MYVHPSMQYIRHVLSICHSKAQPAAGQASNAQDICELLASVPHKTATAHLVAKCLTWWQIASWIWLKIKKQLTKSGKPFHQLAHSAQHSNSIVKFPACTM